MTNRHFKTILLARLRPARPAKALPTARLRASVRRAEAACARAVERLASWPGWDPTWAKMQAAVRTFLRAERALALVERRNRRERARAELLARLEADQAFRVALRERLGGVVALDRWERAATRLRARVEAERAPQDAKLDTGPDATRNESQHGSRNGTPGERREAARGVRLAPLPRMPRGVVQAREPRGVERCAPIRLRRLVSSDGAVCVWPCELRRRRRRRAPAWASARRTGAGRARVAGTGVTRTGADRAEWSERCGEARMGSGGRAMRPP